MPKVLLTDYAWPDLDVERAILSQGGVELVVADRSDPARLAELAHDCDAIMTNWAKVPKEVIAACSRCKIVSRLGIGLDNIDVEYCTSRGIPVTNVPDYCVIEVAEHTIALLFACARKVAFYHFETKEGRYQLQAGARLRRMEGQTLGLIGFGAIATRVAHKACALGLRVLAHSRSKKNPVSGVEFVSKDEVLGRSDYVSLHTPLTSETKNIISKRELALMRPTAYLINTARGGLIDHEALTEAINENRLAGAALDVQNPEPPPLDTPPWNLSKVIVTPHAAFVSEESLQNLRSRVSAQIVSRLRGEIPENVVNPTVLGM